MDYDGVDWLRLAHKNDATPLFLGFLVRSSVYLPIARSAGRRPGIIMSLWHAASLLEEVMTHFRISLVISFLLARARDRLTKSLPLVINMKSNNKQQANAAAALTA